MKSKIEKLFYYIENQPEFFELPIIVDDGCDVLPTLNSKMEQYLSFIYNNNEFSAIHMQTAKNTVSRLKEAIDAYLIGDSNIANDKIELILIDTKKLGGKLIVSDIDNCLFDDEKKQLYKARVGSFFPYKENQMFHIPFNKRGLVQNQRYSVNGMPCLYLGTSTYVCWEELGRPDFNSFWVSRFEVINKDLKILNLSYTIQDLFDMKNDEISNEEKEKIIIDYYLYWIILCACTISVKNKNRVFKEEYIIPQLIMQNIRKTGIDGIMYFSVKGEYNRYYNSWIMKNFAFPADDHHVFFKERDDWKFDEKKYSEYTLSEKLKRAFSLTAPLNMGLVQVAESNNAIGRSAKKLKYINEAISKGSTPNLPKINLYRNRSSIKLSEKYYLGYEYTNFFELEKALSTIFTNQLV